MGNRCVITASTSPTPSTDTDTGVYLHWNGGRSSVVAFLTYCKLKDFRSPEKDNYGYAHLCQVIGNYFGGGLSVGVDNLKNLDCKGDNGVYVVKEWEIVGRWYNRWEEEHEYELGTMLRGVDEKMPEEERSGEEAIEAYMEKLRARETREGREGEKEKEPASASNAA